MSQAQLVEDNTPETEAPEEEIAAEEVEETAEAEGGAEDEPSEEGAPKAKKPQRNPEEYEREIAGKTRALNDERRARQRLESRLERIEQSYQRQQEAEERQRREARQKAAEQEIPNVNEDPLKAVEYLMGELNQFKQREAQQTRQQQEYQRQAQIMGQIQTRLEQDDAVFAQEHPDYKEAIDYYAGVKMQEFLDAGYPHDQAALGVQQHIVRLTDAAWKSGRSPQEIAYNTAKRMGFRSQAERDKPNPLDHAKRGQSAAKTMSGGGRGAKGPVSMKDLADPNLSDEEFDKKFDAWEKASLGRK